MQSAFSAQNYTLFHDILLNFILVNKNYSTTLLLILHCCSSLHWKVFEHSRMSCIIVHICAFYYQYSVYRRWGRRVNSDVQRYMYVRFAVAVTVFLFFCHAYTTGHPHNLSLTPNFQFKSNQNNTLRWHRLLIKNRFLFLWYKSLDTFNTAFYLQYITFLPCIASVRLLL